MTGARLPPGMTCGDCVNHRRCASLFRCPPTNVECDWSPNRFRLRTYTIEIPSDKAWRPYPW